MVPRDSVYDRIEEGDPPYDRRCGGRFEEVPSVFGEVFALPLLSETDISVYKGGDLKMKENNTALMN